MYRTSASPLVDSECKKSIDFNNDYFLGESTFLVPAGSELSSMDEIDHEGVRMIGVEDTATVRSLRRALTRAQGIGTTWLGEALDQLPRGETDAIALGRESLQNLNPSCPAPAFSRAPSTPPARRSLCARGVYTYSPRAHFSEAAKANGTVCRAFDAHGTEASKLAPVGSQM